MCIVLPVQQFEKQFALHLFSKGVVRKLLSGFCLQSCII